MKDGDNLICIYDNTKENINEIMLKIYATFIERELNKQNVLDTIQK